MSLVHVGPKEVVVAGEEDDLLDLLGHGVGGEVHHVVLDAENLVDHGLYEIDCILS